ncbi:MAG: hypothetical protein AAF518_17530 [Spirochaetota bacterium]
MPISQSDIESEFKDFFNKAGDYQQLEEASEPSEIQEIAALLWKNIILKGFSGIIPSSATVSSAADSIESSLKAPESGKQIANFLATAMSTIGGGMSAAGYSMTNSPQASEFTLDAPTDDIDQASSTLAGQIVSPAKSSGMSQLVAPPYTTQTWN